MKNWWLRLGCFLSGYNYAIVMRSSEVAAIKVKQNISALLIVCIIWASVGYVFTNRYLDMGILGSIVGAMVACTIIVQIERQIILSIEPGKMLFIMRILIATLMAIIGSVIIDQLIFKADIEKRKITMLDTEVNKIFPVKSEELRLQIKALDSTIAAKELQRIDLDAELSKNPTIRIYTKTTTPVPTTVTTTDSTGKSTQTVRIINTRATSVNAQPNPKSDQIKPLDDQIAGIRETKMKKDEALLVLRSSLVEEISSKVGFLDELKIMFDILSESAVAMGVWLIWFFILFGLELFILASKWGEKSNVYDETLKHQEKLLRRKLEIMSDTYHS